MWSDVPDRRYGMNVVDAYAEAVTSKVLPLFEDLKAQSEDEEKDYREWASAEWADSYINDDMEFRCLHEAEEDHNIRQALYFDAIPRQMLGLAMPGLYHLWEQLAKQLLYRTLISAHHDRESLSRQLSKADFKTLEKWLNQFKWDGEQTSFECQHFYPGLNRLRLVANVVKHGYGASAMELQEMC